MHAYRFILLSLSLIVAVGAGAFFFGLNDAQAQDPHHGETTAADATQKDVVDVAADGTRFDPAVSSSQIPENAWFCDMGSVHYASLEKGEGSCPICGMNLVQQKADAASTQGCSCNGGCMGCKHGDMKKGNGDMKHKDGGMKHGGMMHNESGN